MSRYKAAADNSEKIEDELKAEKRKLQREVRGSSGFRDYNNSSLLFSYSLSFIISKIFKQSESEILY